MEPTEGQVSQLDFPSTLGFMKGSEEETSPVASDELFLTAIMRAPFPENAGNITLLNSITMDSTKGQVSAELLRQWGIKPDAITVGRQNNPTCEDSCVIGVEVPIQDSAGSSNLHDDKFLELTSDVFLDFLSADDLVVDSELEVFKALLKWGVHNLKQQSKEITTVNMRNIMSSLIQAIRFPNMSKSEIINYVLPLELLLPEQTTWLKDWCNRSTENAQEEEETMFSSKPRTQYTDQEDVPGSNVALYEKRTLERTDAEIFFSGHYIDIVGHTVDMKLHDLQAQISNFKGVLKRANEELNRTKKETFYAKEALNLLNDWHHSTTKELNQTKDELNQTQEELSETKQELAQTSQELAQTSQELAQTSHELAQTKHKLPQTKQELNKTKEELIQTKQELDQTRQYLPQTKREINQTKNELHEVQKELLKAKEELEHANVEKAQTKQVLKESQKELTQTKDELNQTQEKLKQTTEELNRAFQVLCRNSDLTNLSLRYTLGSQLCPSETPVLSDMANLVDFHLKRARDTLAVVQANGKPVCTVKLTNNTSVELTDANNFFFRSSMREYCQIPSLIRPNTTMSFGFVGDTESVNGNFSYCLGDVRFLVNHCIEIGFNGFVLGFASANVPLDRELFKDVGAGDWSRYKDKKKADAFMFLNSEDQSKEIKLTLEFGDFKAEASMITGVKALLSIILSKKPPVNLLGRFKRYLDFGNS